MMLRRRVPPTLRGLVLRLVLGLSLGTAAVAPFAAVAADAQALFDRALPLLCGKGARPDPKAAAALLEQAAAQGHSGAQSLLGWMAMSGTGMPRNDARAARWLRAAAEGGDTAAQNNLGVLYALGAGVAHDHAQAEHWFRAAAAQGAQDAENNLRELLKPLPLPASAPPGPGVRSTSAGLHPALAAAGCRPRRA